MDPVDSNNKKLRAKELCLESFCLHLETKAICGTNLPSWNERLTTSKSCVGKGKLLADNSSFHSLSDFNQDQYDIFYFRILSL